MMPPWSRMLRHFHCLLWQPSSLPTIATAQVKLSAPSVEKSILPLVVPGVEAIAGIDEPAHANMPLRIGGPGPMLHNFLSKPNIPCVDDLTSFPDDLTSKLVMFSSKDVEILDSNHFFDELIEDHRSCFHRGKNISIKEKDVIDFLSDSDLVDRFDCPRPIITSILQDFLDSLQHKFNKSSNDALASFEVVIDRKKIRKRKHYLMTRLILTRKVLLVQMLALTLRFLND
ncbi:hypothetical protein ACH5RR_000890 [Cinchona calisaya]|uniref:Uncharacterized protein n=1 Tax=Cinchona calisaya TaxID=153742 RepID=A0ABD3B1Z7_9GENT